ncbi:MAG: hypothetical protein AB1483_01655 [Candidatus Zixiibacteriota bacterium]
MEWMNVFPPQNNANIYAQGNGCFLANEEFFNNGVGVGGYSKWPVPLDVSIVVNGGARYNGPIMAYSSADFSMYNGAIYVRGHLWNDLRFGPRNGQIDETMLDPVLVGGATYGIAKMGSLFLRRMATRGAQSLADDAITGAARYEASEGSTVLLPRYQAPGAATLTNTEIRAYYNSHISGIERAVARWEARGLSRMEIAKRASQLRNTLRLRSRALMGNQAEAAGLPPLQDFDFYVAKYSSQGYSGDALYDRIIEGALTTNSIVNHKFGIY